MKKTPKVKNPPFKPSEASFTLFLNTQSFGPKGADPGHPDPLTATITTEIALEYRELAAIHVDLRFCQHACSRMLDQRQGLKKTKSLFDSHLPYMDEMRLTMMGAFVTYARCFGTGKRLRLDYKQIWGEKDPARDAHQYFKDIRDKFIAHCINDFEDVGVALTYVLEDEKPVVFLLTDAYSTAFIPSVDLIKWLRRLSKQAQKHVENRMDQLRAQILKAGKEMTAEELGALPNLKVRAGSFGQAKNVKPR
ncbi:MAG: hypothetical protein AAF358_04595 [Pseudomonadota bacterium]